MLEGNVIPTFDRKSKFPPSPPGPPSLPSSPHSQIQPSPSRPQVCLRCPWPEAAGDFLRLPPAASSCLPPLARPPPPHLPATRSLHFAAACLHSCSWRSAHASPRVSPCLLQAPTCLSPRLLFSEANKLRSFRVASSAFVYSEGICSVS